ncbi:hypothetical protein EMPS_00097 [Entomortierella parvispora]|uniref:HAT C-terminal dimerisation domain-containing protein n=1 Tax=Entomortierella parvispora TaxID=205924 RepID=A0A9P3LQJ9_9FUNG|nr:hypothetical protein EMPS_00097 [Entomortierella parvispora]
MPPKKRVKERPKPVVRPRKSVPMPVLPTRRPPTLRSSIGASSSSSVLQPSNRTSSSSTQRSSTAASSSSAVSPSSSALRSSTVASTSSSVLQASAVASSPPAVVTDDASQNSRGSGKQLPKRRLSQSEDEDEDSEIDDENEEESAIDPFSIDSDVDDDAYFDQDAFSASEERERSLTPTLLFREALHPLLSPQPSRPIFPPILRPERSNDSTGDLPPDPNPPPEAPGVWKLYFKAGQKKIGGQMQWKLICGQPHCNSVFSPKSSSSTLNYHFKKAHRSVYTELKGGHRNGEDVTMTQTSIRDSMSTIPSNKVILTSALNWLVSDMQPFSVLDSDYFRAFIRLFNSSLTIPCGRTARTGLLDHRLMLTERLKTLLDRSCISGSMTIDSWTSDAGKPFMSFTFQWLDSNFHQHECALDMAPQPYPHTAFAMAGLIREIIFKWDLNLMINSITTDSARAVENACAMSSLPRIPCLAHSVHNAIKSTLEVDEHYDIRSLVDSVHKLCKLFHSSPKMTQLLQGSQERLNPTSRALVVMMDVVTRWNSTLTMLERARHLLKSMEDVLQRLSDGDEADPVAAAKLRERLPAPASWRRIDILIEILKPMFRTTQIFSSSENGTLATMAPWVMSIAAQLRGMEIEVGPMADFRDDLVIELENRVELTDTVIVASAFHPSFHNLWYIRDEDRVGLIKTKIRAECMRLADREPVPEAAPSNPVEAISHKDSVFAYLETDEDRIPTPVTARDEATRYFARPRERAIVDPFHWWRENKDEYPLMAQLARKYLAMPATSVASERMFSFAGNTVTDKRTRLTSDTVSDIVFSHYASKCISSANDKGFNV